jgi:V-type H+-transporting ATPase subunit C
MSLSDELSKVNTQIENVVRKVERQYLDIRAAMPAPSNPESVALRVNESTVEAYLRKFQWDFARYQYQGRHLSELVSQIQAMAAKIDDELKIMTTSYADKTVAFAALQRKKTIVLSTSDFEDFLKPEKVARLDLINTDTLLTVMIVVPKGSEDEFLTEYNNIGSTIAAFGGPDWFVIATLSFRSKRTFSFSSGKKILRNWELMTVDLARAF